MTALHRAAMAGHADAVRVLLKFGADVNALDGMFAAQRRSSGQSKGEGTPGPAPTTSRSRALLDRGGFARSNGRRPRVRQGLSVRSKG